MHRVPRRLFATASLQPLLFSSSALLLLVSAPAQSAGPAPAAATDAKSDQPVKLAEFVVSENEANPYQRGQALSTSRGAMEIQDR